MISKTLSPDLTRVSAGAKKPVADRLARALHVLAARTAADQKAPRGTVEELCELAGVSRSSLYRHHPAALSALRQQRMGNRDPSLDSARRACTRLRTENAELQRTLGKVAALVDHYYAAYRESRALLDRREKDLADLRRRLESKPVPIMRGTRA